MGGTVTLYVSTGASAPETSQEQEDITINGGSAWECNASLDTPAGYNGQPVRITHVQEGRPPQSSRGRPPSPITLQVRGAEGLEQRNGVPYTFLDPTPTKVTNTIEYPGIVFSQVN